MDYKSLTTESVNQSSLGIDKMSALEIVTVINNEDKTVPYAIEKVLPMLLSHENVEVFFFAADRDITCNLDYYMDQIHYSPDISQRMLDSLVSGDYKVTTDNVDEVIKNMRDTFSYMVEEAIYNYY